MSKNKTQNNVDFTYSLEMRYEECSPAGLFAYLSIFSTLQKDH